MTLEQKLEALRARHQQEIEELLLCDRLVKALPADVAAPTVSWLNRIKGSGDERASMQWRPKTASECIDVLAKLDVCDIGFDEKTQGFGPAKTGDTLLIAHGFCVMIWLTAEFTEVQVQAWAVLDGTLVKLVFKPEVLPTQWTTTFVPGTWSKPAVVAESEVLRRCVKRLAMTSDQYFRAYYLFSLQGINQRS